MTEHALTLDDLIDQLRAEVERSGGMRALARKWDVTAGHVSRVLRKEKRPGPLMLKRLGLRERVTYEPARRNNV